MPKKYTKNEHMHHLNDGNEPLDPEAKKLMKDRLTNSRQMLPKNIGQWLQVTHREVFNRDFERHVATQRLTKHHMSK
jgi:hypothetical protein